MAHRNKHAGPLVRRPRRAESACPAPAFCVLILFVSAATLPSPAERLAALIDGLCAAVARHGVRGLLTAPLLLLLWSRLRRMAVRARHLAKLMAAGAPRSAPPRKRAPRSEKSRPYLRLPRGALWLVRAVPGTASGAATLQFLLDDKEMAAVADFPPMRRLLRPLCHMLGVRPPPVRPPEPPKPAPPPITRASDRQPPPEPSRCDPPTLGPPASPIPAIPRNAA
jgi:hypothetical protein